MTDDDFPCDHRDGKKAPCGRRPTVFVCGQHRCRPHQPEGDPGCTHSLESNGRCSYCGASTTEEP